MGGHSRGHCRIGWRRRLCVRGGSERRARLALSPTLGALAEGGCRVQPSQVRVQQLEETGDIKEDAFSKFWLEVDEMMCSCLTLITVCKLSVKRPLLDVGAPVPLDPCGCCLLLVDLAPDRAARQHQKDASFDPAGLQSRSDQRLQDDRGPVLLARGSRDRCPSPLRRPAFQIAGLVRRGRPPGEESGWATAKPKGTR